MSYFPKPYAYPKREIKIDLNLSNYATKSDLKMEQVFIHQLLLKRMI